MAASASPGAGLGVHFMPAAFRRQRGLPSVYTFCRQGVRLVYALFAALCPAWMHTFCKETGTA